MTNKVKILQYIAMNGPCTIEQLTRHPITDQSQSAFKQTVYQLKNNGDLEGAHGKYQITPKAQSYLMALGQMPSDADHEEPGDDEIDAQLRANDPDPLDDPPDDKDFVMHMPPPDGAELEDFPPGTGDKPETLITTPNNDFEETKSFFGTFKRGNQSLQDARGIFIDFDCIDDEIDCMKSLVKVMSHFELQGMSYSQLRRVTEWFSDRYKG